LQSSRFHGNDAIEIIAFNWNEFNLMPSWGADHVIRAAIQKQKQKQVKKYFLFLWLFFFFLFSFSLAFIGFHLDIPLFRPNEFHSRRVLSAIQ